MRVRAREAVSAARASNALRMAENGTAVAKRSEIPMGTTKRIVLDGIPMLLCNVDDEIYAVEDVCTHDGGPLDQSELEENRIMCPRHGAYFDVTNGAALTLPAVVPLETYTVRLSGDDVYIDL
jgi:3-phenylpropionate/trans-cinnamate dioxygenase ferredoxin subunit